MKNRPVIFIDSGIGGIPYCSHFIERNPLENIIYIADRQNFPYGIRSRSELAALLISLAGKAIQKFNPKIVVLACNTASLSALTELRSSFPGLPFVGTVPAIKPAVLASKTGKIGVLGTELTVNEPYIKELAAQHGNCEITGIAAPELVEFIERNYFGSTVMERQKLARNYIKRFSAAGIDAIVLGCTHFLLMLDDFRKEARPDIGIFESISGISQRIESLLAMELQKKNINEYDVPALLDGKYFFLSGRAKPEDSWIRWADHLSFNIFLMEEI